MTSGFQSLTKIRQWPVVDAREPEGIRVIRGYITIIEQLTEGGAPLSLRVVYLDSEGRPFQSLDIEDVDIFYDAANAVLVEMGYSHAVQATSRPIVGDIIR